MKFKYYLKKITVALVAVIFAYSLTWAIRYMTRPKVPEVTTEQKQFSKRVMIRRDHYGVPHIEGQSDADAAFGLAYAFAEDDWGIIQGSLVATRGQLGILDPSMDSISVDFFVGFLEVWEQIDEQFDRLSDSVKKVLHGYAEGLNYYAAKHPKEVDSRFLPYTAKDIAASFIFRIPLFIGVSDAVGFLMESDPMKIGDVPLKSSGSNAHAVSSFKSADGVTRLNVNSHQPWEGPVAWYEAHLSSNEGMSMTGGTFPSAPFILHGHNDSLGWAMTVNYPDLVDIYKLETSTEHPKSYKIDGKWLPFEEKEIKLNIDLGAFTLPIGKTFYKSKHGPVVETEHGFYAIRYGGQGRLIQSVEQWYRMNKSTNLKSWMKSMQTRGIPNFNFVYADSDNIFYLYNGLIPKRNGKFQWDRILPGNTSEAIWSDYVSLDDLPSVLNPKSGFVQNCNSSPFGTTLGQDAPKESNYPLWFGISEKMNNRAMRSLDLFGKDPSISREEFIKYKFDRRYVSDAPIYKNVIEPLLEKYKPKNENEEKALELLRNWNGEMQPSTIAGGLLALSFGPMNQLENVPYQSQPKVFDVFSDAIEKLVNQFGRVDVSLGEILKLERGDQSLPLGGGEDVLNAVRYEWKKDHLVGVQGDSLVMIVDFPKGKKATSWSVQPYGSSSHSDSPHFSDQMQLFVNRKLKPTLRNLKDLPNEIEAEYHP